MPRLTLIYPCIGRFPGDRYVRSWQMQPLAMAALAGMTPPEWEITFYDDRLEEIDYDTPADLVGISIETFTARRGYQIAAEFRKRQVPVVLGGYHATFCPDEALAHADAVCVGEAEGVWQSILADAAAGTLQRRYDGDGRRLLDGIQPDRRIFAEKPYFSLALVETGRGCPYRCDFCSISAFHQATYRRRPIPEIVEELRQLREKHVFFVDDNMIGDPQNARELFRALKPLGLQWVSQASINVAQDDELLRLMVESGCVGLLIGFESLNSDNLKKMGKRVNQTERYHAALARLRSAGVVIYGTFVFGYPHDTPALFAETVRFAREEKLFLAAFNHVVPFPGTPLYAELAESGQLRYPQWWLSEEYRFGQVPFHPQGMSAEEIEQHCHAVRKGFYSGMSILQRSLDLRANCAGMRMMSAFYGLNFLLQREVAQKRGIPLGVRTEREDA
ncbi:MAG: B12-binding domain-containing radical SAM protein [Armatimonadota bacterium]